MKIIEMTATFGNLHKATLRPGAGFTLLAAPNESGKSTWAAFLRAMLYGFPSRDRSKEGYIAEKTRYQPWSGAPMEGTLTVEWQGRDITLYRGPKGNTPWGTFTAVYTATGEAVPGLTAENCGETLLGVSREVFERTAFVGQGEAALSPSGDLEKRVTALATSGEEDVSFSQVERRLKDWLNRRRVNSRVGLLPQLEEELAQVEETIARQGETLLNLQEARAAKEELEQRKAGLEEQLQAHAAARTARETEKRRQAQADYEAAQAQLEAAREAARAIPDAETLRNAQGDLRYLGTLEANLKLADASLPSAREKVEAAEGAVKEAAWFEGLDPVQASAQAQKDRDEAAALEKKRLSPLLLFLLPLLATAVMALRDYYAYPNISEPYAAPWHIGVELFAPPLWLLTGVVVLILFLRRRKKKNALASLLGKYDVQTSDDILTRAADYNRKAEAAQTLRREFQAVEQERDKLSAQKEELTDQLLRLVYPFAPEVTDTFGISAALSRALQQEERLRLAQARAEAAEKLLTALPVPEPTGMVPVSTLTPQGDPTTLSAQFNAVNGELRRASDDHARLEGELRSLGDPAEGQARRSQLLEELDLRRGEYDAIAAALEGLREADSLLRERFSPAVNQRASHYLGLLTGGKYDRAALTRQFQALAQEAGEAASRQDLSLSGGTTQQLYLAVRLAMCELALPREEPCPILLDDVLDPFDDGRARLALDCLLEVAKERQVLLFTCHSREKAMLEGRDCKILDLG